MPHGTPSPGFRRPDADEMGDVSYDAMGPGVADLCFVALRFACALEAADQLRVGRSLQTVCLAPSMSACTTASHAATSSTQEHVSAC